MLCSIKNNLLSSNSMFAVLAFSSCAGVTIAADRKPSNALPSFAGTAFCGPLA